MKYQPMVNEMKMTGKIDVVNVVKRTSRKAFAGMDLRPRVTSDKTKYNRKRQKSIDRW
jgi:hypothetical protein